MKNLAGVLAMTLIYFMVGCSGGDTSPDHFTGDDGSGGGDVKLCSKDTDCPPDHTCVDGVCQVAGFCNCNYDCDKSAGQVCNQSTHRCEAGAPPLNCQGDCDCFSGESCISGQCKPIGGDGKVCTTDADCDPGQTCISNRCVPKNCSKREDCAGAVCLVCVNNECVAPPPVCQGINDCCVGYLCNFGTCIPEQTGECKSDADCKDANFPRCVDGKCVQECVNDIDCPLPGQVCQNTHCVTPGCKPADCQPGYWCDTGDGNCKPGCDENADCTPPDTCNYVTHQCGQTDCCGGCASGSYCDTLLCQCVKNCSVVNPCPTGYECKPDGRCWCLNDTACPEGSHCNTSTGQCVQNSCTDSSQCPQGWYCDTNTGTCVAENPGDDGAFCFFDANCNNAASYYCDNCIYCIIFDSSYEPSFTCRKQCSILAPNCPSNYECKFISLKLKALCLPKP